VPYEKGPPDTGISGSQRRFSFFRQHSQNHIPSAIKTRQDKQRLGNNRLSKRRTAFSIFI
jgi:hypothetical protein